MIRRARRWLAVLLLAALCSGGVVSTAEARSAHADRRAGTAVRHSPKLDQHTKAKKTKTVARKTPPRPVTSCAAKPFPNGESAYFDRQVYLVIDRLVCAAGDGAVIRFKSWFIADDSPATHVLFAHLALMKKYHRVQIEFFVGREYRGSLHQALQILLKRSRGLAKVGSCAFSCGTSVNGSVTHSKFVTVSTLRSGGQPAVLSTGANLNGPQLTDRHQDAVVVVGNRPVYAVFDRQFGAYWACGMQGECPRHAPDGAWSTYANVSVHFTPTRNDLTALELKRVDCTTGGTVYASSRVYNESAVLRQLNRLLNKGCAVHIIAQSAPAASASPLTPRCRELHEKYIVIDTPGLREVLSGSKDLSSGKYQVNDNQEMINRSAGVVNSFGQHFRAMYSGATSC